MFDYLLFLAPGVLLALWAQWRVSSAYGRASQIPAASGFSGAETAQEILRANGIRTVDVETVPGQLTDHYSPDEKVLRLSPDVYEGRSLASLGIAAHEAGHAIQDARGYTPMRIRQTVVPVAQFGSGLAFPIIILGFIFGSLGLVNVGLALFTAIVLFQLVTLPVEFDASKRALVALREGGLLAPDELGGAKQVLSAAAWTYVAAFVASLGQLIYFFLASRR
jgi:Zn-dependent membrane protease YugP